mgnify:CR=1 FL=1
MVKKYPCPCFGFYTYKVPASEDCGFICPVCFWENGSFIIFDEEPSCSNGGITLNKARENYSVFGSCRKDMTEYVRPPKKEEFG